MSGRLGQVQVRKKVIQVKCRVKSFVEKSSQVSTKSLGQRLKVTESSLKSPERSDIISSQVSMSSGFC